MIKGMRVGKVEKKVAFREPNKDEKTHRPLITPSPQQIIKRTSLRRHSDVGCTLSDLCEEDKDKVSRLVQRIVDLEEENSALKHDIQAYQDQHDHITSEHSSLASKLQDALLENGELKNYRKEALMLLSQYQQHIRHLIACVENTEEQIQEHDDRTSHYNEEISRLEAIISSQRRTIEASLHQAQRIAQLEKILEDTQQEIKEYHLQHEDAVSAQHNTSEELSTLQSSLRDAEEQMEKKDFMIRKLQEEVQVLHTVNTYLQRSSPNYAEYGYGSPIVLSHDSAQKNKVSDKDATSDLTSQPILSSPTVVSTTQSLHSITTSPPSVANTSLTKVAPFASQTAPVASIMESSHETHQDTPEDAVACPTPETHVNTSASHAATSFVPAFSSHSQSHPLASSMDTVAPPPPKASVNSPPRRTAQSLSLSNDSLIVPRQSTSTSSSLQRAETVYSEKLVPTWRAYPEHVSKKKKGKAKVDSPGLKVWRTVKNSYDNMYDDSLFDLVDEIDSVI